ELLAQLFIETRMPHLALERVQKAIAGQPVSSTTLDLYYWLAVAHEASANSAEALSVYKKIQSEDFQFKDVTERVARITAGGGPTPAQGVAAAPPPVSAAAPAPAPAASSAPAAPAPADAGASAPARPAASAAPTTKGVPRFAPKEEIGRGPLGVVLRGEDSVDGRSVALRLIPNDLLKAEGMLPAVVADFKAAAQ